MWHVYQLRSETELLYVGYSRWLRRRLAQHRREKAWWPEVTATSSEEFATEDAARQREKEIWRTGQPKHNKHSPFLTPEERRHQDDRRPYERRREYEQSRNQNPEIRRRKTDLERSRRRRQGGRGKRSQVGPSLFD